MRQDRTGNPAVNDARGDHYRMLPAPRGEAAGPPTQWVSECGLRFRKSTGAVVGSGVWSTNRLDLNSIREIQPGA